MSEVEGKSGAATAATDGRVDLPGGCYFALLPDADRYHPDVRWSLYDSAGHELRDGWSEASARALAAALAPSTGAGVPAGAEGPPWGWRRTSDTPAAGGLYLFGGYVTGSPVGRYFARGFVSLRLTIDGPEWTICYPQHQHIPIEWWAEAGGPHPEHVGSVARSASPEPAASAARTDPDGLTLAQRLDKEEAEHSAAVAGRYDEEGPSLMPSDVAGMFHRIRDAARIQGAPRETGVPDGAEASPVQEAARAVAADKGRICKDGLPHYYKITATKVDVLLDAVLDSVGDGWLPINKDTPVNVAILIHVPRAEHYGPGVYRAILVDMGTGRRWHTTGLGVGRDLDAEDRPDGWQPLPAPPINPSPE